MSNSDVMIIGGGLAGLCCARTLHEKNISFQILEASDRVGGRVRTDEVDGYLLDRGFQVLLTSYPESQSVLDYHGLVLKPFYPGSLIRSNNRFIKIADPFRNPIDGLKTLFANIGNLGDKLRIAKLRQQVMNTSLEEIFQRPEVSTAQYLKDFGFSDTIIERFFRPFFGGVYLESELYTSSRMFEFIFRMFSQGDTAIPAAGMEAIPRQLAAGLPKDSIRTNTRVVNISDDSIQLESGESIPAETIVIATDWPGAEQLDGRLPNPGSRSASYLYYAASADPLSDPILLLNGEGNGLINNLCVPSSIAPNYAPANSHLVSVTVLDKQQLKDSQLEMQVRKELADWFGESTVQDWRHLRTYHIDHALPDRKIPTEFPDKQAVKLAEGRYSCGDYLFNGSIHGAMLSGRHAAEMLIEDRKS